MRALVDMVWQVVSNSLAGSGGRVAALEQGGAAPVALFVRAPLKAAQRREVHVLRRALARAERALAALAVQRLLLPAQRALISCGRSGQVSS